MVSDRSFDPDVMSLISELGFHRGLFEKFDCSGIVHDIVTIRNVFAYIVWVKRNEIKFQRIFTTTREDFDCYFAEIESKFLNADATLLLSPSGIIRGPNWQDYSRRRLGHVLEIAGITQL